MFQKLCSLTCLFLFDCGPLISCFIFSSVQWVGKMQHILQSHWFWEQADFFARGHLTRDLRVEFFPVRASQPFIYITNTHSLYFHSTRLSCFYFLVWLETRLTDCKTTTKKCSGNHTEQRKHHTKTNTLRRWSRKHHTRWKQHCIY